MFIDEEKLDTVLKAARIEVTKDYKDQLLDKINEEFVSIDVILDVNTDGYEPLSNTNLNIVETHSDDVLDGNDVEQLLKNAPNSLYNYFVVPKVIKGEE